MTFKVEYVYYNLIILGFLAAILTLLRLPGHTRLARNKMALANKARQRNKQGVRAKSRFKDEYPDAVTRKKNRIMARELKNVATPWGWPGHADGNPFGSKNGDHSPAIMRFAEKLAEEKTTVQDANYQTRRTASLKALLEDRYGRASKMTELEYRKIHAPHLRDPQSPHDQMDNFPSGKGDQIAANIKRDTRIRTGNMPVSRDAKPTSLKAVKMPWGW